MEGVGDRGPRASPGVPAPSCGTRSSGAGRAKPNTGVHEEQWVYSSETETLLSEGQTVRQTDGLSHGQTVRQSDRQTVSNDQSTFIQ